MHVTELITSVSKFALGRKKPTESDRQDHLFLLNLADFEYHACTKNSKYLRYKLDIFFDAANNFADLDDIHIHAIYNDKTKLKELDEKDGLEFGKNGDYYYLDKKLFINKVGLPSKIDPNDGAVKEYVTLLVQRKRKKLVEVVVNPNLETEIPIYPEEYHIGLVHGATYLLCLTHEGFTTKINETTKNWNTAKQLLMSHYVKGV